MQLRRTFRYRLYPSKSQQQNINNQLELSRQLYNELLSVKKETYKQSKQSLSKYDLDKCIFYFNDCNPDFNLVYGQVKQNISDRVDKAFKNMYARIKRNEKKVGYPRFKNKNKYKSITYPQYGYKLTSDKKLKVSKIGEINIRLHREIKGNIKTMTILRTQTNKYYVSFSFIIDEKQKLMSHIQKKKSIGIDVGLNHFLTTSEGKHIANPRFYRKSENKLARIQRKHSRKKLGSNNCNKSRLKIALCHEKIKHQRTDLLHKLSCDIVKNYNTIGIENLNIKGMIQNRYLAKSISDAGWGIFAYQLQYKAEYAGNVVRKSDKFYPSSKLCSKCNNKQDMTLDKRIFICNVCGNIEDRDTNAAKNLENDLLVNTVGTMGINACEDVGELHIQELTSMKQEATH